MINIIMEVRKKGASQSTITVHLEENIVVIWDILWSHQTVNSLLSMF